MKEDLEDGTLTNLLHRKFKYDVVLSFAGEDREYVESVAKCLEERQLRIFYDKYGEVESWGKDLYVHLDNVYRKKARYCVMFISKDYRKKLWTNRERESAQARAFKENREYILPARFDNSKIPGLLPTIGYISLHKLRPSEFAELIVKKVGLPLLEKFMPSNPVKLYKVTGTKTKKEKEMVHEIAEYLLKDLSLLSKGELLFIYNFFDYGCPCKLPYNIHISLGLFQRIMNMTKIQIEQLIHNVADFGFNITVRKDKYYLPSINKKDIRSYKLEMEVHDLHVGAPIFNVTGFLSTIIDILHDCHCEECARKTFLRLDFSSLG